MYQKLFNVRLNMGFGEAIKTCFSKYFTFRGRARRSEYWYFYLFTFLLGVAATLLDLVLGLGGGEIGVIGSLASLGTFFPSVSAQVRRLHDTGRSGWWIGGAIIAAIIFVFLIAGSIGASATGDFGAIAGVLIIVFILGLIGYGITMLVFLCTDSQEGSNKYGPNPKYDQSAAIFD